MSTIREFHDEAARLGQLAMVARDNGENEEARELARQGYGFELKALDALSMIPSFGYTRSVLVLSAASLAYQCEKHADALNLIAQGLDDDYTPAIIRRDLIELREQINDGKPEREETE